VVKNSSIEALPSASSLRSRVESSLASAIISGELEPGRLISVPALATQFKVSATPVREAMLNLEKRGFVESVKNKGFLVTEVSKHDLSEIAQLRSWLEGPAMRVVATQLRDVDLAHYRELANLITESAAIGDLEAYLAADSAFHSALLELTNNQRLVELVAELRHQTRMVGLADLRPKAELLASANEHQDLLDLLATGDGEAAERFMVHHVGHVIGWWAGQPE
jgi:DNA-binding GntR family transcriptional regulator